MMHRFSTHAIAVSIGALALTMFTDQIPAQPNYVTDLCGDASKCVAMPTETYQGIAFVKRALEADGSSCPDPVANQLPQSACLTSPNSVVYWFILTRGGPAHLPLQAVDHDVFVATTSPIYSDGSGGPIVPRLMDMNGDVVPFGLSPTATAPQAPAIPPGDPLAWEAWYRASFPGACLADPVCNGGAAMTPAQFETMLQASSFGTAVHPVTFTQPDGTQVTVLCGVAQ